MIKERFTNQEWNNLEWKLTGIKLGNKYACVNQVAEGLGYKKTGKQDFYTHNIYEKDGELYYIENRNTGIEIAKIDFK